MGVTNGLQSAKPLVHRKCACGSSSGPTGECEECKKKRLQRNPSTGGAPPAIAGMDIVAPNDPSEAAADAFADRNHAIAPSLLANSELTVHHDTEAARAAKAVEARAFTVGNDVFFGDGEFRPDTFEGRHLIAHEYAHVLQDDHQSLHRQPAPTSCPKTWTKATSFAQLIDLVTEAEKLMVSQGLTDVEDRIHILRGIFYGTTWSMDYDKEKSPVRNLGFQVYTASTTPADPRSYLTCGLFDALKQSAEVSDPKGHTDFGHLIIGLDARRSLTARKIPIPSQGGTGLEISTWIGDLGGGAGMLSWRRAADPTRNVSTVFSGSDFGGSVNLEGDVAAYLVGQDPADPTSTALAVPKGGTIASILQAYLPNAKTTPSAFTGRCKTFLGLLGGTFDASGVLNNKATLVSNLADQIQDFACWYLTNRLRQTGKLTIPTLETAATHVAGASTEVATTFVDALVDCQSHPSAKLSAKTFPTPSKPGSSPSVCNGFINTLKAAQKAGQAGKELEKSGIIQEGEKKAGELYKDIKGWLQ